MNVMPRRVSLTLDSFAVVPGTTKEMKRTFTADCWEDICNTNSQWKDSVCQRCHIPD